MIRHLILLSLLLSTYTPMSHAFTEAEVQSSDWIEYFVKAHTDHNPIGVRNVKELIRSCDQLVNTIESPNLKFRDSERVKRASDLLEPSILAIHEEFDVLPDWLGAMTNLDVSGIWKTKLTNMIEKLKDRRQISSVSNEIKEIKASLERGLKS